MARYTLHLSEQRTEQGPLDDNAPVWLVIEAIVATYQLPRHDADDRPIHYALYTQDRRRLSGEVTLAQNNVAPGSELWVADRRQPWWMAQASDAPPAPLPPPPSRPWWQQGQTLPLIGMGVLVFVAMVGVLVYILLQPATRTSASVASTGPGASVAAASPPTATLAPAVSALAAGSRQATATLAPASTATPTATLAPTATPAPQVPQLTVSGIRREYIPIRPSYFFQGRTSLGAYLFADDQLLNRLPATQGNVVLSEGDTVELLQDLGAIYQVRVRTNKLDPDDPKVIGAIGYVSAWIVTNENVPPIPTPTPRPTQEPPRLRVSKLNSNDSPSCFSMQIRGINATGWRMRVDGTNLSGTFDGAGNARICGLRNYQEGTYTIYDQSGQAVPGGRGIPVRGGDIMIGDWR
ncbi:hypothetical protein A6A03_19325 [Chloroflexus islandicus]|uniref:Uncharacterized protein n=1 Tax=Chloroflexus islandicus TaxID=1707952 RepID=A0A178M0D7_9CHLR|nr:hypothetical protein [Chloroflexus islandicus]OAN40823.1 hypothetical protein A6A03_19325 [Chloroflexus islandicus]